MGLTSAGLLATALALAHAEGVPFVEWMESLVRPDIGGSCCGPSDQVYVDDYALDPAGDGFVAYVGREAVHIPAKKVIWDRVNPTGRGVLFWTNPLSGGDGFVFCFVPSSGV